MFDPSSGRPRIDFRKPLVFMICVCSLGYFLAVGSIALYLGFFWIAFILFRRQRSPYLKIIPELSLPIAVGLTPHFLFVASYDAKYEHEETSLARAYESGVLTLHAWLKPLDELHCPVLALILVLALYVSTSVRSDLPIMLFIGSRRYLSRAMLFLTATLSFTVLTNSATSNWSPDIQARFAEKDRDRVEADAKLAVVDRLTSERVSLENLRSAMQSLDALVDHALSHSGSSYVSMASSSETASAKGAAAAKLAKNIAGEARPGMSMEADTSASIEGGKGSEEFTLEKLHEKSSETAAARERAATRTEALASLISTDLPFDMHEVTKRFVDELAGDAAQEWLAALLEGLGTPTWDAVDRAIRHQNDALGRSLNAVVNRIAERCATFSLSGGHPSKTADREFYELRSAIASGAVDEVTSQVKARIHPVDPRPEPKFR